eukprot:TRINITY_DN2602_c0_g1_i2.p1 TRINITY_DN2602_c0_g1~~TRINITY_DN2602_c0_g1_i2.p1  ORF type:complete len:252 (+),score=28.32 TRINITY_DN2602_c0_g1_i2:459-1214(+)
MAPKCLYASCVEHAKYNNEARQYYECCSSKHYHLYRGYPEDRGIPEVVPLQNSDPKYISLSKQFITKFSGSTPTVVKIYRVHVAKAVSDAYFAYQKSIIKKYPKFANGVKKTHGGPGNELRRFHGTSIACGLTNDQLCSTTSCAVCSIIKAGFQLRFAGNGCFGKGTYFSSASSKSNGYNSGSQDKFGSRTRCMFICLVIAGNAHVSPSYQTYAPPLPNNSDSVVYSGSNDELIVYQDGCAIPRYLIVYQL